MFTLANKKQFLDRDKVNLLGILLTFFIVCKYYSDSLFKGFVIPVAKISMVLTILLSVILIVNNIKSYNIYHYLLFAFLGIQFVITRNITLIYSYLLALGLINIDMKKVMKVYLIANLVFFIIFLTLNLLGIKPSEFINGRNDFGFGNPNGAFIAAFLVWISYLYIRFDNLNRKDLFFLVAFPILVYTQTQTRTGIITVFGVAVLLLIFKFIDINKTGVKIAITSVPFLLLGISLVIAYGFKDNYMIDRILSRRPSYWYQYLSNSEYGLNLMGYSANIRDVVFNPRLPLDSGYIWGLYSSGIIAFIMLMIIYTYAIYQLCKDNKKAEVILILSIFIYAFAESILLDLGTNISFAFVAYSLCILGNDWRKGKRHI